MAHDAATLLTLVFSDGGDGELVVQLTIEGYAFAEQEPAGTYPIPASGSSPMKKVISAEILEPKGSAAILGGSFRVDRWIDVKFAGGLELDLADGGFIRTSFLAKRNDRLTDPAFKGGGFGGD